MPTLLFSFIALAVQADPTLAERVADLARDPAHREELLRLGPAAIRPLRDLGRPELEPILLELKFAAGGEAGAALRERLKTASVTFSARDLSVPDALRLTGSLSGIAVFLDPDLQGGAPARRVTIDVQDASMKGALDLIAARAGLDYGWVRGRIVMTLPDRLWPRAPGPVRALGGEELARLRGWIAKLEDASLAVRAEASRELEGLGEPALPHLEEASRDGDLDRRTRLRDAIGRIRRRAEPARFSRSMALEAQELSAAGRAVVDALKEHLVESIDLSEAPLSAAIPLVLASCHVEGSAAPAIATRKVACVFDGQRGMDVLFFLTVPYGLDAYVKDGKVVVDAREAVEAAVAKR